MKTLLPILLLALFTSTLSAQLVLEKDINLEAASSWPGPDFIAELDNKLYFQADDGINGEELYQYDITSGTSTLVANIRPYEESSGINQVIAFDGKIYFSSRDVSGSNRYLFVHDPADNSTQRLMDSQGMEVDEPSNMFVFNGQLFFGAEFPGVGIELGRYDPVLNEISVIEGMNASIDNYPNFFTVVDNQLWFTASNSGENDSRLWRFDPSDDSLENIVYDSPNDLYPSMSFLYFFDGKFFFSGFIQGIGTELWIYDPTTNSLLDIPEVAPGLGSSSPSNFTAYEG